MKQIVFYLLLIQLASSAPEANLLFRQCPVEQTGVDFKHPFDQTHPMAFLYHSGYAVGGICLGDVNGDGKQDIYLVNGPGENKLYFQGEGGRFEKSKIDLIKGTDQWGTGASLVDIDNDGDLDLYQCNYDAPNQLFLNDGRGKFVELKGAAGLAIRDGSMTASFADIDNDGDLDMFLLCNRYYLPEGRPASPPYTMKGGVPVVTAEYQKYLKITLTDRGNYEVDDYGRADYLFLNEGIDVQGLPRFKDISHVSGVRMEGFGLSSVWWDFDSDGDLDLYVANDFTAEDRLFRNDGVNAKGLPRFTNVIADYFPHISWSSMGSDVADLNQDGLPDLMSLDMSATTHFKAKSNMGELSDPHRKLLETGLPRQSMMNHLFFNSNSGMFKESAIASGVSSSDWSWTVKFGDLDNDGYQDVFIANGMSRNFTDADRSSAIGDLQKARIGHSLWDIVKDGPPMREKNLVYQNLDGKKFNKRPDWGLGLLGMSYSSVMGDLDNDGDLDLVVSDLGEQTKIFINEAATGNNLRVGLIGTKSNRMGIGARVIVTDENGIRRTRWMNPWTGFQSQNDSVLHFGLGKSKPVKLEVHWPSGIYQNVPLDGSKFLSVTEKEMGIRPAETKMKSDFVKAKAPDFQHKEKEYDDFKRQPLLPQKLSQLGPCLAKGDIDGDGDEDFFVGGAQNQAGALFLNEAGKFSQSKQVEFNGLAKYAEDSAAVMFDADGDGDLDLLVVTGSTEYEPDDTLYKDRLYLNTIKEGKPHLEPAPDGAFPFLLDSGSCVAAADYDADGDIDLFIGSRSIPGKYPLVPVSRLIRNDSAVGVVKFTDVTEKNLAVNRMVTDAAWADIDQDGDPDLCVATDWGPVTIYQNNQGKLENVSAPAGTSAYSGWWRSIHAVDVDGDGDLDLVAGNTGTNTKYKQPLDKYPAMLYYGDLDGSGKSRIVEAKMQKEKDRPLPVRGRY